MCAAWCGHWVSAALPRCTCSGCNDPGIEELAEYFGRDGARLRRQPHVTYRVLQNADHTLGAWPVRAALIDSIRAWYRSVWGDGEAGPRNVGEREAGLTEAPIAAAE